MNRADRATQSDSGFRLRVQRLTAVVLLLLGAIMLQSAMEYTAQADDPPCIPKPVMFPARCRYAHQHFDMSSITNQGCETNWFFWCEPTHDSNCGMLAGRGLLLSGQCYFIIEEVIQSSCVEDLEAIFISMTMYYSECRFTSCSCACVWLPDYEPPVLWATCDCIYHVEG